MASASVTNEVRQQLASRRILDVTADQWEAASLPNEIQYRMIELHNVALALSGIARVLRDDELGDDAIVVAGEGEADPIVVPLNSCTRGELHIAMKLLLNNAHLVLEELPEVLARQLRAGQGVSHGH